MKNISKKFYTDFYNKTNGFIPSKPLNQEMYPGDFFQIHKGDIVILGNIFKNKIVAEAEVNFEYGIKLNPNNWSFSNGVTKPYTGGDIGHNPIEGEFKFSKQILAFKEFGSFFFTSNQPESVKIINWNAIASELIIKLTQVIYSFRELYVVIESAAAPDWTLAISGSDKGELEMAIESENSELLGLFGDQNSKTIQARDIEFYHKEKKKRPLFFKAKKLVVQPEKLELFISELIKERTGKLDWATNFFENKFNSDQLIFSTQIDQYGQACVLDMLQANQLNPNTALQYFKWEDANLDDVEKLFISYE
mgnify:CR=1 FL=1|tara:strand:- start:90535 stop:91455 length:921 start_codon:yes stop_codon:yes gene_type:complete